jgi:hypothetical protein
MTPKKKRGRKRGKPFQKGFDPRRKRGFPIEACKKGYQTTKAKFGNDIHKAAWFWRKMRSHFRARGTWYPQSGGPNDGEEENGHGDTADVPY